MTIPPGIVYLARTVPRLLARPVLLFVILQKLLNSQTFPIPKWLSVLLSAAFLPGQIFLPAWYRDWLNDRKRRALGLEPIPTIKDDQSWGGLGLGILKKLQKTLTKGNILVNLSFILLAASLTFITSTEADIFGNLIEGHENIFHYKMFLEDTVRLELGEDPYQSPCR